MNELALVFLFFVVFKVVSSSFHRFLTYFRNYHHDWCLIESWRKIAEMGCLNWCKSAFSIKIDQLVSKKLEKLCLR